MKKNNLLLSYCCDWNC